MAVFICSNCGEKYSLDEEHYELGDEIICAGCANEETVICERCGERIWRDDNAGNEDIVLCQSCYDDYYVSCESCGRIIRRNDAYYDEEDNYLCAECHFNYSKERMIKDYYYKPEPIFYGRKPRFLGVELEIDEAGEYSDYAKKILNTANINGFEYLYCKHDGSLADGFELVSHPMSLEYHYHVMPWEKILKQAVNMGYRSHKTSTCGLHVHVNRTAFGLKEEEQDAAIARILYFFEKHWEELLKFSRRSRGQLERWAARYGYKEQPQEILKHAKSGYHGGRYTCINLQNVGTIEFRMFRGTLKYNTFIATLQLVDKICELAVNLSDEEIKNMPWTTFAGECRKKELVQYLKERNLYINEPVESEEEL